MEGGMAATGCADAEWETESRRLARVSTIGWKESERLKLLLSSKSPPPKIWYVYQPMKYMAPVGTWEGFSEAVEGRLWKGGCGREGGEGRVGKGG